METLPGRVFAIGDIHLNLGLQQKIQKRSPGIENDPIRRNEYNSLTKEMTIWGSEWSGHIDIVQRHWDANVTTNDIVILAGDISWSNKTDEARPDLEWISSRPGIKVLIKGNHDYWWPNTQKSMNELEALYNINLVTAERPYCDENVIIGGTKLDDFTWNVWDPINPFSLLPEKLIVRFDQERQDREKKRVQTALGKIEELQAKKKRREIFVTHHPPIGQNGEESDVSKMITQKNIEFCVFGHIHTLARLYERDTVKNIDDVIQLFKGVDCVVENTRFQLVASDVRKHVLTLITEFKINDLKKISKRLKKREKLRKQLVEKEKEE
ncbi:hypothetical protein EIN_095660 [Entamoeba invadens IP1]|uniref:Calcineurin-like phosphoesterase domain-containing protein n=2 Tax=Entamoeba invadens TaxID=33085 RepID=A0A0A1U0A2_ENTIV|nr:hypothetical protein EIN_095660 [Entamoeba invadens IP1]ELP87309.1 hypothetical protein EIN_095660 [Entamoeba invadens IP1]BAN41178.1 hypothetical protein, conserved [Entamoeba invadens]|eukprot:XP_004254080.1 hypothetical protein EIN_095660 [Entamoeba invadens IP1]